MARVLRIRHNLMFAPQIRTLSRNILLLQDVESAAMHLYRICYATTSGFSIRFRTSTGDRRSPAFTIYKQVQANALKDIFGASFEYLEPYRPAQAC